MHSMCHATSKTQTDEETRPFVRLSVVSVRGVHPMGGQSAVLHRNLRGVGGGKTPGSTNKYTKFGQFIISKISIIIATRGHNTYIFKAKMHQIRFLASVRLRLGWSLTLLCITHYTT